MQTLNQDIKDKTFRKVYLLFGDEPFLVNSYKKRLREAITGDDTMNYNYFEGKGPDVKEIISLADTMPFFAERRFRSPPVWCLWRVRSTRGISSIRR